jgi:transcriptional regulator with XRE-family HTH domain
MPKKLKNSALVTPEVPMGGERPRRKPGHKISATRVDVEIGRRVRIARITAGLNQDELAQMIDLTFQQLQKYENGVNKISISTLVVIARILKMPIRFFVENLEDSSAYEEYRPRQLLEASESWTPISADPVPHIGVTPDFTRSADLKLSPVDNIVETMKIVSLLGSIDDPVIKNHLTKLLRALSEKSE